MPETPHPCSPFVRYLWLRIITLEFVGQFSIDALHGVRILGSVFVCF